MDIVKRRQTFRAYPTGQQAKELSRLFGCTRVVRNHFIATMQQAHQQGVALSLVEAEKAATTTLKRTEGYDFLNEVSAVAVQQAARNTTRGFREFFRVCAGSRSRVGFPRYASKRSRQTASFTKAANFRIRQPQGCRWGFVRLPKLTGEMKFRACRDLDWDTVGTVTVTRSPSGVYEVSVTHEVEPVILPDTVTACGVDLGLVSLAAVVSSNGARHLVDNPRFYPSSQTCSVCGRRDGKKPLSVRSWVCAGCHSTLDRDFNAATNLMLCASEAAGHADSLNACGGNVRLRLAGAVSHEAGTHRSCQNTGAVGIPAL